MWPNASLKHWSTKYFGPVYTSIAGPIWGLLSVYTLKNTLARAPATSNDSHNTHIFVNKWSYRCKPNKKSFRKRLWSWIWFLERETKHFNALKKVSPMSFQQDERELCSLGFFSLFKLEDKVSPELSTPPQTSAIKILSTSAFDKSSNLLRFFFFSPQSFVLCSQWVRSSGASARSDGFRWMEYCKSQLGIIVTTDVSLIRCVPTGVCDCVRSSFSYYLSGAFTWMPF